MIGAIYVGLSGLSAFSTGLRTISTNVASLNVPGYKTVDIRFAEIRGDSDANTTYGSDHDLLTRGYGVRVADTRIDFSQGALTATTGEFDLAINGDGFLSLLDGEQVYYTRTGEFMLDDNGVVVDRRNGYQLAALDAANQLSPIDLGDLREIPGVETSRIEFSGNVSSAADEAIVSEVTVFDTNGEPASWDVTLTPVNTIGFDEWNVVVTEDDGSEIGSGSIRFIGSQIDVSAAAVTVQAGDEESGRFEVVLDFSQGVTSIDTGPTSSLRASEVDGSAAGMLTTLTVNEEGAIEISYSNGEVRTADTIALAIIEDPQRLEQIDGGLFVYDGGDDVRYAASDADGPGLLVSGQLEASNVDLSRQFSDLVLIQRGFQASSQIVTISNEMIQDLYSIGAQQ